MEKSQILKKFHVKRLLTGCRSVVGFAYKEFGYSCLWLIVKNDHFAVLIIKNRHHFLLSAYVINMESTWWSVNC
jgi:hypothetical protein